MTDMREVTCKYCDKAIHVPDATLGHISHDLLELSEDDLWLNYLCPECKHLQYAIFQPVKLLSNAGSV
jgi:phage FluMu protein Com